MLAYCHMSQETILVPWDMKTYFSLPRRYYDNLLNLRHSEKNPEIYMLMSPDLYFISKRCFVILSFI